MDHGETTVATIGTSPKACELHSTAARPRGGLNWLLVASRSYHRDEPEGVRIAFHSGLPAWWPKLASGSQS